MSTMVSIERHVVFSRLAAVSLLSFVLFHFFWCPVFQFSTDGRWRCQQIELNVTEESVSNIASRLNCMIVSAHINPRQRVEIYGRCEQLYSAVGWCKFLLTCCSYSFIRLLDALQLKACNRFDDMFFAFPPTPIFASFNVYAVCTDLSLSLTHTHYVQTNAMHLLASAIEMQFIFILSLTAAQLQLGAWDNNEARIVNTNYATNACSRYEWT